MFLQFFAAKINFFQQLCSFKVYWKFHFPTLYRLFNNKVLHNTEVAWFFLKETHFATNCFRFSWPQFKQKFVYYSLHNCSLNFLKKLILWPFSFEILHIKSHFLCKFKHSLCIESRADCDVPCFEQLKATHLRASPKQQSLLDVLLQRIKTWPLIIGPWFSPTLAFSECSMVVASTLQAGFG